MEEANDEDTLEVYIFITEVTEITMAISVMYFHFCIAATTSMGEIIVRWFLLKNKDARTYSRLNILVKRNEEKNAQV